MRTMLAALAVAALTLSLVSAQPAPARVHIRGTVTALRGDVLSGMSTGGPWTVNLTETARVNLVVKSDLAHITRGSFVGSAAVPGPDGMLRALEVHIFPEALRGTGEGFRAYDLGPASTMTNATVSTIGAAPVDAVHDRVLTLTYAGGEKQVVVGADTPVVAFEPGTRAALVPGAHVSFVALKADDGELRAASVSVGRDGLVPPM